MMEQFLSVSMHSVRSHTSSQILMSVPQENTCAVRMLTVLTLMVAMSARVLWDTAEMGSPVTVSYYYGYNTYTKILLPVSLISNCVSMISKTSFISYTYAVSL